METRETTVQPEDGRSLRVLEAGDLKGFPVFVHHGTPASRLLYEAWIDEAARRGIRLICHDRPGYGGSTRRPGRNVGDVTADVTEIANAFGIKRFASWGMSGGGPHALACAALLEQQCVAAATFASVGPYGADGLDYFTGMGEDNVADFKLALKGEDALRPGYEEERDRMASGDPAQMAEALTTLLTPVDEAALTGEIADYLVAWMAEGLARGIDGWVDDTLALVRPWGFDLRAMGVPVLVWHGREDRFVPLAHGEWLGRTIPGAETRFHDEEGHVTLVVGRVGETLDWLLAHA